MWISGYAAGEADGDDAAQDVWVYHQVARIVFLSGHEIGYDSPCPCLCDMLTCKGYYMKIPRRVTFSTHHCLRLVLHRANRRHELGPQHHQRRLLLHLAKQLRLFQRPRLLQRLRHLGRHQLSTHVFPGPGLLQPTPASSGSFLRALSSPSSSTRPLASYPNSLLRFHHAPLVFGGAALIPPATPLNYLSWGVVGFIFNKLIWNRFREWWMQYNYVLSAEFGCGIGVMHDLDFLHAESDQYRVSELAGDANCE